jgi:hypothetical protein
VSYADRFEVELLLRGFVDAACAHKNRCPTCRERGPWCEPLRRAFEALLHCRDPLSLRAFVVALRAWQNLTDWQAAA